MRFNSNIITRIAEAKQELEMLKTTQPIGGDSWIMYRANLSVWLGVGSVKTANVAITFTPENHGVFPVLMYMSPDDNPKNTMELLQPNTSTYTYVATQNEIWWVQDGYIRLTALSTRKGVITATVSNLSFY